LSCPSLLDNPGCDIYYIAEHVANVSESCACIDADAQQQTVMFRQSLVEPSQPALDFYGGSCGKSGLREFRHNRIANGLNYPAFELLNGPNGKLVEAFDLNESRSLAMTVEKSNAIDYVSEEDRSGSLAAEQLFVNFCPSLQELVNAGWSTHSPREPHVRILTGQGSRGVHRRICSEECQKTAPCGRGSETH
jgi:hypothetical protein